MSHIMKKKYYSYEQICVIALCNMAEYIKIQKHYFVSKTTVSSNELTKSLKVRKVYLLSFCFFCFMTHAYSFLSRFCPSWTFQTSSSEIETRKKGFFFRWQGSGHRSAEAAWAGGDGPDRVPGLPTRPWGLRGWQLISCRSVGTAKIGRRVQISRKNDQSGSTGPLRMLIGKSGWQRWLNNMRIPTPNTIIQGLK